MAAELWDVLAVAANIAQLSGLHAVMLVAVAARLLRVQQGRRECAKLERRVRKLSAMLEWPTHGLGIVLQHCEMGVVVRQALDDATSLIDSYNSSTLWRRVRSGRRMSARFRETLNTIDSYCDLVLVVNAQLALWSTHPT